MPAMAGLGGRARPIVTAVADRSDGGSDVGCVKTHRRESLWCVSRTLRRYSRFFRL